MHRIDSDGATLDNKFTEGNAGLSIPATIVSAAIMNAFQEELVKIVLDSGQALKTSGTDTFDQVEEALYRLHKFGGRFAPILFAPVNNQAVLADVTGFPVVDQAIYKAIEFLFTCHRKTDSGYVKETGRLYATWDDVALSWDVSRLSVHDQCGLTFAMTLTAGTEYELQYTSENLAGTSYVASLKITDIKFIKI
jgi:hypothetical protein